MKVESEKLILDLIERTRLNINEVKKFSMYSDELNYRFGQGSWNILECIEHLNLYGDYYIPAIKMAIQGSNSFADPYFKSGLIGNYFAQLMLPRDKVNKMKTFSDKNPLDAVLDKTTLEHFVLQQEQMLSLLDISRKVDLNSIKIPVSFTKLVRLKLGDTFRFVIYHNERHIVQANKILIAIKNENCFQV